MQPYFTYVTMNQEQMIKTSAVFNTKLHSFCTRMLLVVIKDG